MKRTFVLPMLLLALSAAPAAAQGAPAADANPAVGALRPMYETARGYLMRAAEAMPEGDFAFRPTPEVRSFGQVLGHIINFHYMGCAAALGEASPTQDDIEKTRTTKAALVEALRESSALCDRAFAQTDAQAMGMTKLFGGDRTRLSVLAMVSVHDWEHYGNLVTYMRLKGMVPPSSQRS